MTAPAPIGRILHTPAVAGYLAGDVGLRRMVRAAVADLVPLIVPSSVLAAATGPLADRFTHADLTARARILTGAPPVLIDHLVAGRAGVDRALRAGVLAAALELAMPDAHTAAIATTRWWPVMTTRAAATELLRIEPRLAIDYIG